MNAAKTRKIYDLDNIEHTVPEWSAKDFVLGEGVPLQSGLAYKLNRDKREGYYVEIGAGHYQNGNNTYVLEKEYGWKGVSIDNSEKLVEIFNQNRSNPCILGDGTTFDWDTYFKENNFPETIDFLSIDIDSITHKYANLLALLNLPITRKRFNVIAIEHAAGIHYELEECQKLQRSILVNLGYSLVVRGHTDDIWTNETMDSLNGLNQLNFISDITTTI